MQAPAQLPEEAVSVAAAASGLLQGTPSPKCTENAVNLYKREEKKGFAFWVTNGACAACSSVGTTLGASLASPSLSA